MNSYPIYIVSKGRGDRCLTAKFMLQDGVKFKIVVEPQDEEIYSANYGAENVLVTPFSNLGMGSTPARNFAWEHSIKQGAKRHWVFDDNIYGIARLHHGRRIKCDSQKAIAVVEQFTDRYTNIAISGYNYTMFATKGTQKPMVTNCHVYSSLLIDNSIKYRWRLKYNEDVDLCLQVLHTRKLCTVLFNAFLIEKVSTTAKMKGGNQTDLYKGNSWDKKVLKAKSLEEIWPQYVDTKIRFGRPHHVVKKSWKMFTHPLIRRKDIDWDNIESQKIDFTLNKVKDTIQSDTLKKFYTKQKRKANTKKKGKKR
jgi:hypothetical protein